MKVSLAHFWGSKMGVSTGKKVNFSMKETVSCYPLLLGDMRGFVLFLTVAIIGLPLVSEISCKEVSSVLEIICFRYSLYSLLLSLCPLAS